MNNNLNSVINNKFRLYRKIFNWNWNKSFNSLIRCTAYLRERNSFSFNSGKRIFYESRYWGSTRKFYYESSTKSINYFYFKRRYKKLSNYNTRRSV